MLSRPIWQERNSSVEAENPFTTARHWVGQKRDRKMGRTPPIFPPSYSGGRGLSRVGLLPSLCPLSPCVLHTKYGKGYPHSGYIPESGTRARGNDEDPPRTVGHGQRHGRALAALLLFPPAPAAGAGAALGAVLLLTGLCVKQASTAHTFFELGSLSDHRRKVRIKGLI